MKINSTIKMFFSFTRGNKQFYLFSIIAAALSSLLGFLNPLIVGFTVDSVIGDEPSGLPAFLAGLYEAAVGDGTLAAKLLVCALGVALCAVLAGVCGYFTRVFMAKGTESFVKQLRDALFEHTQRLPFEWHTNNQTGDIIQRCTSDVETARRFVSQQLIEVIKTIILIATALTIMFTINVPMALVVFAFIPVILSYTMFFFRRISKRFLECDEAEGELTVLVQENLTGVRVVRAFGREKYETDRFNAKNLDYTNKWLSLGYTFGLFWSLGDVFSSGALLAVIVLGSFFAANGVITFGNLLVFISYTQTIMWPVRQMGRILSEMSKAGVSLGRIKEILDAPAEPIEPGAVTPPLDRDIEVNNVSFAYGAQRVLSDVSFTVESGTTFGILGATGSGKSTVTYLLNRLYDLPEGGGSITIGGVDIRRIDKSHLRRGVGLVLQEPFLFSKTIFENIDIAARCKDMEKVRAAARTAAVDESIMSFAKGYDTIVGERGVTLSGGQKQRVAIARTLMTRSPIMVFDDSMSSLDMETDAQIREALRTETAGATVILVSHRISTLMTADMIMVMENGRVTELGTHSELVERGGLYKRVYDLQSGQ